MKINTPKTEHLLLGIIILMGFVLRLYNYANLSLSNDELSAIYRLNYNSLRELFSQGVGIDYHPGGVQIFLYYWVKLFGFSVASIRFPFIISGTLAILFTYLFSRRWLGPVPSLLSAAAIAFLEFPLLYSQIARPYGSGLMLILFLTWTWSIVLKPNEGEQKRKWLYTTLLGLAFAFNLYNHYFSALLAFIIGISGFALIKKPQIKTYLFASIVGSLLFLPHIKMTLYHMSKGGLSSWLSKPSIDWPWLHLIEIFNGSILLLGIITLIVIALYIFKAQNRNKENIRPFLMIWFLLPLSIGYFYSLFVNPVLQHSILIFSFPFLIVYIFSFVKIKLDKYGVASVIFISSIILIHSIIINRYYQKNYFQDFKSVAETIKELEPTFEGKRVIRFLESNSPNYIKYYLDKDTATIKFAQSILRSEKDLLKLKSILDSCQSEYLEYVLLSTGNNIAFNMMATAYPYLQNHTYFSDNAQVYVFSKYNYPNTKDLSEFNQNIIAEYHNSFNEIIGLDSIIYSQGLNYHFNENDHNSYSQKDLIVKIKLRYFTMLDKTNSHIVFELEQTDGKKAYWGSAPLRFFTNKDEIVDILFTKKLPKINSKTKILKVYIWNPDLESNLYKNLNIQLLIQ